MPLWLVSMSHFPGERIRPSESAMTSPRSDAARMRARSWISADTAGMSLLMAAGSMSRASEEWPWASVTCRLLGSTGAFGVVSASTW